MIRSESIRFKLMRDNVEYGEIFADGSGPTMRMDSSGEIKTSLQGSFLPKALDSHGNEVEPDWMRDEVKPVLIIDGTPAPLGMLMPEKVTPKESRGKQVLEIQMLDRCWRVRDMKVEGSIYLPAGTSYMTAIEQLLTASGIATIIKTPSAAVLSEKRCAIGMPERIMAMP